MVIYMDHCPEGSIHMIQAFLTQMIIYFIPGLYKYDSKATPAVKSYLAKNEGS